MVKKTKIVAKGIIAAGIPFGKAGATNLLIVQIFKINSVVLKKRNNLFFSL